MFLDKIVGYVSVPLSENISKRNLCLPAYWKLSLDMWAGLLQ